MVAAWQAKGRQTKKAIDMKTKDKQIHSKTKNDKNIASSQSPCAERFAPQFKKKEPGEHALNPKLNPKPINPKP